MISKERLENLIKLEEKVYFKYSIHTQEHFEKGVEYIKLNKKCTIEIWRKFPNSDILCLYLNKKALKYTKMAHTFIDSCTFISSLYETIEEARESLEE